MNRSQTIKSLIIVPTIGILVALAGSQNGLSFNGVPIFALCVALAFLVNWLAFVPAYSMQSEKFYDFTGSLTYISVTIVALLLSGKSDLRSIILAALVMIWAARLGTFLLRRVR